MVGKYQAILRSQEVDFNQNIFVFCLGVLTFINILITNEENID